MVCSGSRRHSPTQGFLQTQPAPLGAVGLPALPLPRPRHSARPGPRGLGFTVSPSTGATAKLRRGLRGAWTWAPPWSWFRHKIRLRKCRQCRDPSLPSRPPLTATGRGRQCLCPTPCPKGTPCPVCAAPPPCVLRNNTVCLQSICLLQDQLQWNLVSGNVSHREQSPLSPTALSC